MDDAHFGQRTARLRAVARGLTQAEPAFQPSNCDVASLVFFLSPFHLGSSKVFDALIAPDLHPKSSVQSVRFEETKRLDLFQRLSIPDCNIMQSAAFLSPLSLPVRSVPLEVSLTFCPSGTRPSVACPSAVLQEPASPVSPTSTWRPSSWRSKQALQQPLYPDAQELVAVQRQLSHMPPLVAPGEMHALQEQLAAVCRGNAFVLQGGDCAESLDESADGIKSTLSTLFKMAVVLMWGGKKHVIKIGRMAGQYGKPRSSEFEKRDGVKLPSYRGENINGAPFTFKARTPDPHRMLRAYHSSAATSNLARALAGGGFADLTRVKEWGMDWSLATSRGRQYMATAERISEALSFMDTCGLSRNQPIMTSTDVYTSHEALLLPYEEALTRFDVETGNFYAGSGHLLWVGERTRGIHHAHVEFARGISNPVAVKAGPTMKPEDLLRLCDVLNPHNIPGRLMIIIRMGADKILQKFPPLIRAVQREGRHVVWVSDSMHGNTFKSDSGFKTRSWNQIIAEVRGFFTIHAAEGSVPGGLHFEMTGKEVTECVGGTKQVKSEHLSQKYESLCDPRLNQSQSLEMAFEVAEILRSMRNSE
ncbi:unnamed protein product [Agarophyton chilense]